MYMRIPFSSLDVLYTERIINAQNQQISLSQLTMPLKLLVTCEYAEGRRRPKEGILFCIVKKNMWDLFSQRIR